MENKTRIHYTAAYLVNPQHRVTVDLIGLGGTGSQVLSMLGRLNASLIRLGHPGIHVRGWDPDVVSEANIGRQLFSEIEVGSFKAVSLISRVNRFFGSDWEAMPHEFGMFPKKDGNRISSNLTVSCVDTIKARVDIGARLGAWSNKGITGDNLTRTPYYWLDFGNAQKTGQMVLGTLQPIEQPKKVPKSQQTVAELPHVLTMFPDLKRQKEEDSGPSCSLAEALTKQDLFINASLVPFGMTILWKLFKEYRIVHHGAYLNLDTLTSNPINV